MNGTVNVDDLRSRVKDLYSEVATDPTSDFHFELGREVAERLGYEPSMLDSVPAEAVDSFAGVGCPFLLADVQPGEFIADLGSGSGMDSCVAALLTGNRGRVVGFDMTSAQLERARRSSHAAGISNVEFHEAFIEELPLPPASVDLVISNGVINLVADKGAVFAEIARILKPGGRMAISDIVSERQLTSNIVGDASLWAACIGGAAQEDEYLAAIASAGLSVVTTSDNSYRFLSRSAMSACDQFGVKSVSILAHKRR